MNNDLFFLTIAIPTYNGGQLLKEQIGIIIPQITNEIKVVVYDNNSSPSVRESIGDLCTDKIQIIKNTTNIGGDANICRCFENCDTEWLWVLSDNDIINDDAICTVIKAIKNNIDSVFINFKSKNNHITTGLAGFCESKPDYANAFCISLCIYNNYKLKPYLFFYYHYLSSWHGQLIVILKFLEENSNGTCTFLSNEIIRTYTATEWPKIDFIERLPIFLSAFKGQSLGLVKMAFQERIVFHLLLFLSNLRMNGNLDRKTQLKLFVKTMPHFELKCLFSPRNFKQLLVMLTSFIHKNAASKMVQVYKKHIHGSRISVTLASTKK